MANKQKILMDKKAMGFRPLLMSIIIIVLFTVSILSFSINFIGVRNPTSPILTDNRYNTALVSMNNSLSGFSTTANNTFSQFAESEPSALSLGYLLVKEAFFIPIEFARFMFSGIFLIGNVLYLSFGGGLFGGIMVMILGLITASILVAVILLGFKLIRTGESEI